MKIQYEVRKQSAIWDSLLSLIEKKPLAVAVPFGIFFVVLVSTLSADTGQIPGTTAYKEEKTQCSFFSTDRNLQAYTSCSKCTSQNNQDEILRRIFDTIGTSNKHCVEFGFGYDEAETLRLEDFKTRVKMSSGLNTHALVADGWTPTLFDAEVENLNIHLHKNVLTPENIGEAFKEVGVPIDVDYVSIDVDSIDVWLFHGLLKSGYRPRVVSIEYNANFPLDMPLACEQKWAPWKKGSRIYGASAASINIVAEMFGYQVVEIMPQLDMFFVRKDILDTVCTPDSLPSLEFLAKGNAGELHHRYCKREDAQRLVDFPIALQGDETRAKEVAMQKVAELNTVFNGKFKKDFCAL